MPYFMLHTITATMVDSRTNEKQIQIQTAMKINEKFFFFLSVALLIMCVRPNGTSKKFIL